MVWCCLCWEQPAAGPGHSHMPLHANTPWHGPHPPDRRTRRGRQHATTFDHQYNCYFLVPSYYINDHVVYDSDHTETKREQWNFTQCTHTPQLPLQPLPPHLPSAGQ